MNSEYTGAVWPLTTVRTVGGDLCIGGVAVSAIVADHGTPTYVLDEADVRQRCREYATAFGAGNVAYAGKALLCRAVAGWVADEGLGLYAGSAGELHVARAAGVPAERVVLYGNAKTPHDLQASYADGVGTIVVESLSEISRLAATAPHGQRLLLRVLTGLEVADGVDRRFGLRIDTDEALGAVARILAQPGLNLVGLDCSVGHQISRPAAYEREVRALIRFLAEVHARFGLQLAELNIGGGHAVVYSHQDQAFDLDEFATRMRDLIHHEAQQARIGVPRLSVSPGRAIVGRAGITVYRVLSVNEDRFGRRLIAIDGGLSDGPTSVLCGSRHSAMMVGRESTADVASSIVVGRHNDTDDVIVPSAELPADTRPGDLLAVAGTGAYHHARASNYQLVGRPPLVAARDGRLRTLIRRETLADLDSRDVYDTDRESLSASTR